MSKAKEVYEQYKGQTVKDTTEDSMPLYGKVVGYVDEEVSDAYPLIVIKVEGPEKYEGWGYNPEDDQDIILEEGATTDAPFGFWCVSSDAMEVLS